MSRDREEMFRDIERDTLYQAKELFIGNVLRTVNVKKKAREKDVFEVITEEDVALTEVEEDVYKYILLSTDEEIKGYAKYRYLSGEGLTNKEIADKIGFSEGKIYYVKKRLIEGAFNLLDRKGRVEVIETKDGFTLVIK